MGCGKSKGFLPAGRQVTYRKLETRNKQQENKAKARAHSPAASVSERWGTGQPEK